ncbi:co-chaperone SGT1 [Cyberlindnera jadinii NRRL Y-1542]|uniref:SGS-domain-containing protein n=1 Tax=Cyberlindnera jadinii (strain ATCC 18201 / CBS 1600 / BCRC 20928 / JCM 3617 / NBRC 0987 / NRRL Y-1542) TaxID=983966 RepID=A0A1E4S7F4_CYBJN|nr:SGS-domain-containing protein [Cyberlindnera jadinii NRRL Y-1542]ODV75454.1 SGS-domain-containing protein [Cyberlindnera jadinii NRRL Y-1542]
MNGEQLLQHGHVESALDSLNQELKFAPRNKKLHLNRGVALNKLKRYDEAAEDVLFALDLAMTTKDNAEDKGFIAEALLKLVIIYYNQNKLEDAVKLLNLAKVDYGLNSTEATVWEHNLKRKVNKLSNGSIDLTAKFDSLGDVTKLYVASFTTTEPQSSQSISKALAKEKEELEQKMLNKDNLYPVPKNIKIDWFQSNETITVSLFVKNIPKDDDRLKLNFHKDYVDVEFPISESSEFQYHLGPFYSYIDVQGSSYKVFGTKLELYLKKANPSVKWRKLERLEHEQPITDEDNLEANPVESSSSTAPMYPSSSKKHINWDSLKIDDDEEEETGPDQMFKRLYKDADEDTKRAMMKSYVESEGTVLSMDWKDVGSRFVKVAPPGSKLDEVDEK